MKTILTFCSIFLFLSTSTGESQVSLEIVPISRQVLQLLQSGMIHQPNAINLLGALPPVPVTQALQQEPQTSEPQNNNELITPDGFEKMICGTYCESFSQFDYYATCVTCASISNSLKIRCEPRFTKIYVVQAYKGKNLARDIKKLIYEKCHGNITENCYVNINEESDIAVAEEEKDEVVRVEYICVQPQEVGVSSRQDV